MRIESPAYQTAAAIQKSSGFTIPARIIEGSPIATLAIGLSPAPSAMVAPT